MTDHPNQPESDEADRESEPTPGGVAHELEERAREVGATTSGEQPANKDTDSR